MKVSIHANIVPGSIERPNSKKSAPSLMNFIAELVSISKAIERMLLKAYKAARHQNKISDRSNFDCRADTLCLNDFMAQNGLNQSPDITLSDAQGSPAGIHGLLPREQ